MTALILTLPPAAPSQQTRRAILLGLIFLAMIEVLRTAWVSDDCLITVRCILNALHGYGPNFNIDERVQPYTHPLWFLALLATTWLVRTPWLAILILSAGCSMASLWLLYSRIGGGSWRALLLTGLLLVCKPYIDFSTSGLENPLSNMLILAVIDQGLRQMDRGGRARWPLLLYALLYLTRADLGLLMAPFMGLVLIRTFLTLKVLAADLALAAIAVLAWSAFSLCYYGFLVPNTAFAKLGTHIPHIELARKGCIYLLDCMGRDLVVLPCIAAAIGFGLFGRWVGRSLAAGILLYVVYLTAVGGDFMSGRFLVAPLVAAMACLVLGRPDLPAAFVQAACLALLGLLNLPSVFPASGESVHRLKNSVVDERAWYSDTNSLTQPGRFTVTIARWPDHIAQIRDVSVMDCGGLGNIGLESGPEIHVSDRCALVDPLLSHLPMAPVDHWRIGHFMRAVPDGYEASLREGRNMLADPTIHALYDDIRLVTRGPLFSRARWGAIWRLNTGLRPAPR